MTSAERHSKHSNSNCAHSSFRPTPKLQLMQTHSYWTKMLVAMPSELLFLQKDRVGAEQIVSYGSRSLSRQEQNYFTTRKEMLGLVNFVKQYGYYLLGFLFIVHNDQQALQRLHNFRGPKRQTTLWQKYLQRYTIDCEYRAGGKHADTEALSRRPISSIAYVLPAWTTTWHKSASNIVIQQSGYTFTKQTQGPPCYILG